MELDEDHHQAAESLGQHKAWKEWRCDSRVAEGVLHLYCDQAYNLYKLRFALEQLNICSPVWDDPEVHWESSVQCPTRRLVYLPEAESRKCVASFLLGRPEALVIYHVLYAWYLDWQEAWNRINKEPPDEWVIADVSHVFDRVIWNQDEDRFHLTNRVVWVIVCMADIYVVDADFQKGNLQIWSGYPNPTVIGWIKEQLIELHKVMSSVQHPWDWRWVQSHVYLTEVSPLSAMLGLIGRWLNVSKMPKTDTDVNRHLGILPQFCRELLKELYTDPPDRFLPDEEATSVVRGLQRPGTGSRPEAKGRSRLLQRPPRVPSR